MDKIGIYNLGGWDGHEPEQCSMIFKDLLESEGVEVEQTTFEVWTDKEKMVTYDVVVSVYTMSEIEEEVSLGFR